MFKAEDGARQSVDVCLLKLSICQHCEMSCFRCHAGSHTSTDGQTITDDCNACHNLLATGEENPKILTDLGMQ